MIFYITNHKDKPQFIIRHCDFLFISGRFYDNIYLCYIKCLTSKQEKHMKKYGWAYL